MDRPASSASLKVGIIPADIDARYRWSVIKAAGYADSAVQKDLEKLFKGEPEPNGALLAQQKFGKDLEEMLKRTARIVEALENFFPGFKRWLGRSGWGNDSRLIGLLHSWQLEAERKKWMHRSKKLQ